MLKILSIAAVLSVVLLGSCSSAKVGYGKYGRLKLYAGEVNHYPVGRADVAAFDSCCAVENDEIFLNRVLVNRSAGYGIYISVSETLLQGEFENVQVRDKRLQLLDQSSGLVNKCKVNAYLLKKSGHYIARFVYVEVKSGLLVIYDYTSGQQQEVEGVFRNMTVYLNDKIRL